MHALVTGAAGFIGSHLTDRLLADGHRVLGVDDLSTGRLSNLERALQHPRFRLVEADITTAAFRGLCEQEQPDVVFHLAAQMDVRKNVADPLFDAQVNVLGTVNVLEAAVRAGAGKVVFASSGGTVYGEPEQLPVPEDAPLRPTSPYGAAKVSGEAYVSAFGRLHGLAGTSLALGNVYGPRQDPHGEAGVVAIFTTALLAGEQTRIFGDGSSERDYVYVDDVVSAFVAALQPETDGKRYNVGTSVGTSVSALHTALAGLAGVDDAPSHLPMRTGELQAVRLDSRALGRATGWEARMPLELGLARTVDTWRRL